MWCFSPGGASDSGMEVKRGEGGVASSSGEPVCLSLCAVGWEDDLSPLHSHRELEEPTSRWGEEEIRNLTANQERETGWSILCTVLAKMQVSNGLFYIPSVASLGSDVHLVQDSSAQQLKAVWDHA